MKNLLNLGKSLSKIEQKSITGGNGFPDECIPGEEYLSPQCDTQQQALADSGDTYWQCICGTDAGIWDGGPKKGDWVKSPSGYPYGGIG